MKIEHDPKADVMYIRSKYVDNLQEIIYRIKDTTPSVP